MRKVMTTLVLALVVSASPSQASTVTCQRIIAKAGSQFVMVKAKALEVCEWSIVRGRSTGPCPNRKARRSIAKATAKLSASIGKACGGDDKMCGGDTTNEDTPASLGWPDTCPGFERGPCRNQINDCGGIAACLACVAEAAVGQAIGLYYDELALPSTADPTLNECQQTIGKATVAFLRARSMVLQRCWDARLTGEHVNSCVPPAPGDGEYLAAISYLERKTVSAICKACGGGDQACGGGDDLTPAQIGFASLCPAVTISGGLACGAPITDLQSLVDCVDCVTEFKADCVDRLQVPEFAAYPSECNACPAPVPTGPCPTALELTTDGAHADLDIGWTGLGHNARVSTDGRLTLAVSGCAGSNQPTCGQCNLSGPLENAGGAPFDTHRCEDASWVPCSTDGDCADAGVVGPCVFFVGAPLPVVAGGISICVVNEVNGAVTGTINIEDGSAMTNMPLISKMHFPGSDFAPCPQCVAGLCTDGPRIALPCSVNGTSIQYGDVSLDCPPNPGANAGTLRTSMVASTGNQWVIVSAANPSCRQNGYTSQHCLCDTCNNANAEACMTNADCPISGSNPGICGGRRCIGGSNDGAPCSGTSECPGGGSCTQPGEPTQPSSCIDDPETPVDGSRCADVGNDEGECPDGPTHSVCSTETFRSCTSDADCTPGSCPDCAPGQACVVAHRPCFLDRGTIGLSVLVAGHADVPCGAVARSVVGALFCVAPLGASTVNATYGLPGLGRVRLPLDTLLKP